MRNRLGGRGAAAAPPRRDWFLGPVSPPTHAPAPEPLPRTPADREEGRGRGDLWASPLHWDTHPSGAWLWLSCLCHCHASALAPGQDARPASATPVLPPPPRGRALGAGAHASAETHLEAFVGGDEQHVEGLPALEGNARASLLSAPGSVLQAVEDHRGLVQPRVEMQGGLAARLLAAQQVYVEPGRWGMRAGVPFCRGLTFCPGPPPFPGTSAVPRQVREGAVADWRPRSPVSRASAIQLGTWTHMALGEGHCALPGVPLIPRGWDLPRNHGPEDQGAPGGQGTPSSQRARTIAGMAGFPGTPDSQES